jgi:predicted phage replisome organizer
MEMADVKWIKLSTNMFEDEKIRLIESLPEADTILIIWVKLLAQAGKTNASGYIYLSENIPFTDEMLATIFNRPLTTVRLALKTFEQFGMIEISNEHFISISNWEKHQNLDGLEKIREQERLRKQRQREKKKLIGSRDSHGTVPQGHATEVEVEVDKEKNNTTTTILGNPIAYFETLLCRLSPRQSESLYQWIDDFNGQVEIILEAINIADSKNKRYFGFVEFLLKEWADNKLPSLDRVRAFEKEKFNKLKTPRTGTANKKPTRTEHLPDWYHEQEGKQSKKPLTEQDSEKMKAIEERLKKYKKEPANT